LLYLFATNGLFNVYLNLCLVPTLGIAGAILTSAVSVLCTIRAKSYKVRMPKLRPISAVAGWPAEGAPHEVVKDSLRPTASIIQRMAPWFLGGLPEMAV
jgi:hypothetical protein